VLDEYKKEGFFSTNEKPNKKEEGRGKYWRKEANESHETDQ
jgi:hypothetical protein